MKIPGYFLFLGLTLTIGLPSTAFAEGTASTVTSASRRPPLSAEERLERMTRRLKRSRRALKSGDPIRSRLLADLAIRGITRAYNNGLISESDSPELHEQAQNLLSRAQARKARASSKATAKQNLIAEHIESARSARLASRTALREGDIEGAQEHLQSANQSLSAAKDAISQLNTPSESASETATRVGESLLNLAMAINSKALENTASTEYSDYIGTQVQQPTVQRVFHVTVPETGVSRVPASVEPAQHSSATQTQ